MKVVFIVLNYNNPDDTEKCLDSIKAHAPDSSVVVVDNASTKGDIGAVCEKYPAVKLIRSETNLGFGRGNNLGLRWALKETEAEYLFILNNDAYIDAGTTTLLAEFLDAEPDFDVVGPRIVFSDRPHILWYGGGGLDWTKGGGRSWGMLKPFDGVTEMVEVTLIPACAMMIRRETIKRVGGFDPRYFMYSEDVELCARIVREGGRLAYLPAPVVYHRAHGSIRPADEEHHLPYSHKNPMLVFFLENAICNILLTFDIYARGMERLLGSIFLTARWTKIGLGYLLHGRFDAPPAMLRGLGAFLKMRKAPFVDELSIETEL